VQAILVDRDYQEAITYSFVDAALLHELDSDSQPVALANPISSEMSVMRSSLWAGLVGAVQYNLSRQQGRIRLFETGLKFVTQGSEIIQNNVLSGVIVGGRLPEQWGAPKEATDFFDVKGDVEALLEMSGVEAEFRMESHSALHPGQTAAILVEGVRIGWLGCIHPRLAQKFEIPRKTYLFELKLDVLLKGRLPRFEKLSRFPSIRRDIAIVVNVETPTGALCDSINQQAGSLLQDLLVFDVYQGGGIESGRKSVALGLILQDSSRTLTDVDVDSVISAITGRLEKQFGATLRE
jgi:phenylalanyl-tRNA synthetase beta chain